MTKTGKPTPVLAELPALQQLPVPLQLAQARSQPLLAPSYDERRLQPVTGLRRCSKSYPVRNAERADHPDQPV